MASTRRAGAPAIQPQIGHATSRCRTAVALTAWPPACVRGQVAYRRHRACAGRAGARGRTTCTDHHALGPPPRKRPTDSASKTSNAPAEGCLPKTGGHQVPPQSAVGRAGAAQGTATGRRVGATGSVAAPGGRGAALAKCAGSGAGGWKQVDVTGVALLPSCASVLRSCRAKLRGHARGRGPWGARELAGAAPPAKPGRGGLAICARRQGRQRGFRKGGCYRSSRGVAGRSAGPRAAAHGPVASSSKRRGAEGRLRALAGRERYRRAPCAGCSGGRRQAAAWARGHRSPGAWWRAAAGASAGVHRRALSAGRRVTPCGARQAARSRRRAAPPTPRRRTREGRRRPPSCRRSSC